MPDDAPARGAHAAGHGDHRLQGRESFLTPANPRQRRRRVPRKVGDPSPIKHVFYVIRENRTYDQVFGDMGCKGNSDPNR